MDNYLRKLSNSSFLICGVIRDAERGLRHNIPVIQRFCRLLGNYQVIIFENDSTDKTKMFLEKWRVKDSCVHIFCKDTKVGEQYSWECLPTDGNPFYCQRRIGKMVFLRNQYIDYIINHHLTADYLMVVDLDVEKISFDGLLSCFQKDNLWDAVTAYGYSIGPNMKKRYHDTFALEEFGTINKPRTEKNIRELQSKYRKINNNEWIRVDSAYGGMAIYRFSTIYGLHYKLLLNDDENVSCRCEHTSLALQMKERGFDHIFINPNMKIHYQKLTFKVCINSLRRYFQSLYNAHRRAK